MARIVLNETSYHGAGSIAEIAAEVKGRGLKKALVCSDPDLIKFGVTQKVLDVLDGATLLCEFKTMRSYTDASLCEAALPLLDNYKGAVCIESFNPFMVRWFRKHAPRYIRGILSKKFEQGEVMQALRLPLASLFANWLCRPDFIAYQHTDHAQPFFRLCRLFRPMTVAWTVQSPADTIEAKKRFDAIIFEGFLPTDTD